MRHRGLLVLSVLSAIVHTGTGHAAEIVEASYTAGGTAVVKQAGQPRAADEGVMACSATTGQGIGGACISFGHKDSILVTDAVAGRDVAFQVCIDNNGDGRCVSPSFDRQCPDQIFFSHEDGGRFFNPLGPLPTSWKDGCPGGPFKGYVIFICNGVHEGAASGASEPPHVHPASTGTAMLTGEGTGFGNFCGGAEQSPSDKGYTITP